MTQEIWVDFSEWQGRLSLQHMQFARALGVTGVIAQLWGSGPTGNGPNDHAEVQLTYAAQAGLKLAGYIWVPPDGITQTFVLYESAMRAAGALKDSLCFIAPDLEGGRLHPTSPANRLNDLCMNIENDGFPVVIYNRKNNWATVMGPNITEFSRYPLWEARYALSSGYRPETAPDIDWNWNKYGGWQQRAILQYAGTAPVNGWSADWNVLAPERLGFELTPRGGRVTTQPMPPQPTEEDAMSSTEFDQLNRKIDEQRAWVQTAVHDAIVARLAGLEQAVARFLPSPLPSPTPNRDRTYTVQPGDTLSLIAKRRLGNAGRFSEIAALNGIQNPNVISVGQVLRIPQS